MSWVRQRHQCGRCQVVCASAVARLCPVSVLGHISTLGVACLISCACSPLMHMSINQLILCLPCASCAHLHNTGMDFYVVLERPGYRVARRRRAHNRVGVQHRVTKEDAMKW